MTRTGSNTELELFRSETARGWGLGLSDSGSRGLSAAVPPGPGARRRPTVGSGPRAGSSGSEKLSRWTQNRSGLGVRVGRICVDRNTVTLTEAPGPGRLRREWAGNLFVVMC